MHAKPSGLLLLTGLCSLAGVLVSSKPGQAQRAGRVGRPEIPRTWEDEFIATLEVPSPEPGYTPVHIKSAYYYRIPVRPVYRTYPWYRPGKEPPGYMEWLRSREPEVVFDASILNTEQDWVRAGELVFHYPVIFIPTSSAQPDLLVRSKDLFDKDDISPFVRYVIRKKGVVENGISSCADCHSRVMPDGSIVIGVQGNRPVERINGTGIRIEYEKAGNAQKREESLASSRAVWHQELWTPWVREGPQSKILEMSLLQMAEMHESIPPGVLARQRSSILYPPAISNLIGIKDIHYLDRSGLVRHRGIADLMRYAAMNQGADMLASFGGFIPLGKEYRELPDPATQERYSDEQLYALALYVYSLRPPHNPNKFDAVVAHGQKVFEREGCTMCHTPPLYTNNKLTPAEGFTVPKDHLNKYEILPISVGTDPDLTMKTRRGTGYYKVPSLRGVWYRSMFGHSGWCARLEDWFDPRRVRDDYVPTGFKPYSAKTYAVKGHAFGLDLSADDKEALIAFLKTL
jgi:hypothetical protein